MEIKEVMDILLGIKTEIADIKKQLENAQAVPSKIIQFPMTEDTELKIFDDSLADVNEWKKHAEIFKKKLVVLRSAKTLYSRRLCLKELLFSE